MPRQPLTQLVFRALEDGQIGIGQHFGTSRSLPESESCAFALVLLKFAALKYKLAAQRQDQAIMKDVLKKMRDCYFAIEDPAARKDCTRYIIDLELQGKVTNPDPPAD